MQLKSGQQSIEFEWPDITGNTIKLSDYRGRKVLLSFYRYARCPFCNLRLHTLSRRFNDLKARGLDVIVFMQSPAEAVKRTSNRHQAPFPILADYEKVIYSKYGITSSFTGMLKAMFLKVGKLMRGMFKGYIPIKIEGDPLIMPADFLINPDGSIHTAHYGNDAGDHLAMENIDAFIGSKIHAAPIEAA